MQVPGYQSYQEDKVHTGSSFPYNTYLCTIPLDFSKIPTHWHEEVELIVVQKGEGQIWVDLQRHDVGQGDIILIRPGQLHSIEQTRRRRMEYENILFRPEMLLEDSQGVCSSYIVRLLQGSLKVCTLWRKGHPRYNQVAECIRMMDLLSEEHPAGFQLGIKGALFQLFFHMIDDTKETQEAKMQRDSLEKIKTIISYVEQNYFRPITVEEMAKVVHYSKSHFMKFFKAQMGISFVQYVNNYRLTMAEKQLKHSTDSLLAIAEKTGFPNLSYFHRRFKERYGVSPGKFRERIKGGLL